MKRLSDEAQAARTERLEALKSGAVIQPDNRKSPGVRESRQGGAIPGNPSKDTGKELSAVKTAKPDKVESPPAAAQMGYAKVPDTQPWLRGRDNPTFGERLSGLEYRCLYLHRVRIHPALRLTGEERTGGQSGEELDAEVVWCATLEELQDRAQELAADGYVLDIEVRACRDETQNQIDQ